ncbi:MAG: hypothetical protein KAT71_01305 [Gammaproteobacteria bacterium]|nr:hypothetical protein [Gammaproteobacteria bacterium]
MQVVDFLDENIPEKLPVATNRNTFFGRDGCCSSKCYGLSGAFAMLMFAALLYLLSEHMPEISERFSP